MTINHITINVSDLERATAFYCNGLGFKHVEDHHHEEGEEAGTSMVEGRYRVHSRHLLSSEGLQIILNFTELPTEPLPPYRRQYGITNLAVDVDDIEKYRDKLQKLGGTPVDSTRRIFQHHGAEVDVLVCLDPDGQPVEIIAPVLLSD